MHLKKLVHSGGHYSHRSHPEIPSRLFRSMKPLMVRWEWKKACCVLWGREKVPINSSPGIILQLPHCYKEKLTQQSSRDAECLQSTHHWGKQAKCKENIFTNSTCTEESSAIFRAAAKSARTFGRGFQRALGGRKVNRFRHVLSGWFCL